MSMLANTSILVNPLATVSQLESSGSQLDGIPIDLENSLKFAGASLIQAAGVLLSLTEDVVAQAIITFARFFIGPEGGSLGEFGVEVSKIPEHGYDRSLPPFKGDLCCMHLSGRKVISNATITTRHYQCL